MVSVAQCKKQCMERIDGYGRLGYFNNRPWLRAAFQDVPREHFAPDRVWLPRSGPDGRYPVLDRHRQPEAWLRAVYTPDLALITQIADGRVRIEDGPTASSNFTSSLSCTAVVVDLLHYLNPRPGERILEVGTGTGYTTALLAHRAGDRSVVSVEIDPGLARQAQTALHGLGAAPRVVCGDGEEGYAAGAPYDRLLSTASVYEIPETWLRQLAPGGRIITPFATPMHRDVMAWLTCDGHGNAHGGLITPLRFMKLRGQRLPRPWRELGWPRWPDYRLTITNGRQHIHTIPNTGPTPT